MTSARRLADTAPRAAPPSLWLRPWLPAVVGALCFANSLPNQFTYDDGSLILCNPRLHDWTNVRAIWLSDWWEGLEREDEAAELGRDRLYRPLTLFSFALNYAANGLNPLGYHLVNVALHAAACWLLWRLAHRVFADAATAAIAALLFAVHPVHVEAVAGVVGRAEVLSSVFLMLGLLTVLMPGAPPSLARTAASWPLFALALLAKETAICYPAVVLALWLATLRERTPPLHWWLMRAAALVVPAALYLGLRYVALDGTLIRGSPAAEQMNPFAAAVGFERVLGVFTALGHYARLIVVPRVLSFDYGLAVIDARRGFELMTAVGLIAATAWIVGLAQVRSISPPRRLIGALSLALLASYVLISNSVLLIGVGVAERLMYWPSAIALLIAAVLARGFWTHAATTASPRADRRPLLRVLGVAVLAGLAVRSIDRNWDWYDNATLFARDAQTFPQGAHHNLCLARELHDQGLTAADPRQQVELLERADRHAAAALQINPGLAPAMSVRGQILMLLGREQEARRLLESALLMRPGMREARRLLDILDSSGDLRSARVDELREQIASQPADVEPRLELAERLIEAGSVIEARTLLAETARLNPQRAAVALLHAKACAVLGDTAAAIGEFRRTLALTPNQWEAHTNLAMLIGPNDPSAALYHAEAALRLQPADLRVQTNYAETLVLNKRIPEALRILRGVSAGLAADDPLKPAIDERIAMLERN